VHRLLTFLLIITFFFAYIFSFIDHPGQFEPRKQKESRVINEQKEERSRIIH